MKKRRLIRDINSINKMNNIKDITKIKVSKYQKNKEGPVKQQPLFKSKSPPLKNLITQKYDFACSDTFFSNIDIL